MAKEVRRDNKRAVLQVGESIRSDGRYQYSWTDKAGKRHYIYASTLTKLRTKKEQITENKYAGLKIEARKLTINDMYNLWVQVKRGLKNNTLENYKYMYNTYTAPIIGKRLISSFKKTDIKKYYNSLVEEYGLRVSTVESIHTVLQQVFELAMEDGYIRTNPTKNALVELKRSYAHLIEKKKALTKDEQNLFLDFIKDSEVYNHWYPIFAVLVGTGMRVGEATGLRWCDIDLEEGMIDINHTLVYFSHRTENNKGGCYFAVNSPKTKNSVRTVPMMSFVKEAFLLEKKNQEEAGLTCKARVDGYTDFVFLNQYGQVQHYGTLNKAIKRIIRDCNYAQFDKSETPDVLLPNFSCHTLRHTFTTRMCEAGINIKVIQNALGHSDISTTMNIYADVTKDLKKSEFENLDEFMSAENQAE